MKIGFFTRCLCDGGTERVAAKLSLMWHDNGHKVVFLTQSFPSESDFEHKCENRIVATDYYWESEELKQIFDRERFDVVIVNGGWNNLDYRVIVQVCRVFHVKIATILHHSFNNWALGKCNEGDFDKDDILPFVDCLICVDKLQALWWSQQHSQVVCIDNPVSVDYGCRGDVTQDAKNYVWIGRPKDTGKRIEIAIEAFKGISEKCKNAKFTILGAIDDEQKKALLHGVCKDVRDRITFVGYKKDIKSYLESATLNIVTTLWEVTVPQVILEAQAMGVPTVALDLPVLRGVDGVRCVETVEEIVATACDRNFCIEGIAHKPFIDVGERNSLVAKCWESLLGAMKDGTVADFIKENSKSWRNLKTAELLLQEIQRGERKYVKTEYQRLKKVDKFLLRINRLLRFLKIKI